MVPASEAEQLHACANWNANKAAAVYNRAMREKNNDLVASLLRDYRRLIRNCDDCRRRAWLLEHRMKKKVKDAA